jgi:TonB family protein
MPFRASLILVTALTSGILAQSGDVGSLDAARQLYGGADYQGALDMLDRLLNADPSLQDRQSIDLHRVLCFVALGRTTDADQTIEAMITRDPLYHPAESEIPPRLRLVFSDKRKKLLPSIIQSRYELARSRFDQRDYKAAAEGFTEVLIALSDPDIAGTAKGPPLSDLRVLATSFNDLAVRAMTPLPAPRSESTPPPPELPRAAAPVAPKMIYDSDDADVIPPVTVKQALPPFSRPVFAGRTGVLLIVIDESGTVESAIITQSLDGAYDPIVLAAAKTWAYRPATRNGVAVKYRKRIQLTLPRQTNCRGLEGCS